MTDNARKQIVLAAGIGSQSGDTRRLFGGFQAFMIAEAGYRADDFLEATYGGKYDAGRWVGPAPYDVAAFDVPLATSVAHCAQALLYWARERPGVEWHLLGYSLGGLVLLEAAIVLHRRAYDSWGRHLRSVSTLSAPLNGCHLGEFAWLGDLFGPGAVSAEVVALGNDPGHRRRLQADVAALRAAGVAVTTLVEADDVIVQPEDGIVGPPDPDLVVACSSSLDSTPVARYLGHGRIVHEPRIWRRLLAVVGPQVGARPGSGPRAASSARGRPNPPPPPGHVLVTPPPATTPPSPTPTPRGAAAEPPSSSPPPGQGAQGTSPPLLEGVGPPTPPPFTGEDPPRDTGHRSQDPASPVWEERSSKDILDQQLAELKQRMRAEGRLPPA